MEVYTLLPALCLIASEASLILEVCAWICHVANSEVRLVPVLLCVCVWVHLWYPMMCFFFFFVV